MQSVCVCMCPYMLFFLRKPNPRFVERLVILILKDLIKHITSHLEQAMSPGKEPKGKGQSESKDEVLVVVGSTSHPFSYDAQRDKSSNGARKKGSFTSCFAGKWPESKKQKHTHTYKNHKWKKEKTPKLPGWFVLVSLQSLLGITCCESVCSHTQGCATTGFFNNYPHTCNLLRGVNSTEVQTTGSITNRQGEIEHLQLK